MKTIKKQKLGTIKGGDAGDIGAIVGGAAGGDGNREKMIGILKKRLPA